MNKGEQVPPEKLQKKGHLGCVANAMRWTGRVWSLLLIVVLIPVFFFWYLDSAGGSGPPGYVYAVGITIVAGMIVVWWHEMLGALVSLAGLIGFYVALWAFDRSSFRYWSGIFVFILPPITFLLTSSLLRRYMAVKSFKDQNHID